MFKTPETLIYSPDLVEHFQRAMTKHAEDHKFKITQFVGAVSTGIAETHKYVIYLEEKIKNLENQVKVLEGAKNG